MLVESVVDNFVSYEMAYFGWHVLFNFELKFLRTLKGKKDMTYKTLLHSPVVMMVYKKSVLGEYLSTKIVELKKLYYPVLSNL
jgi:hypothetical protein